MASFLDDLLPGISDDVTYRHIVTRLPWSVCQSLSRVSRQWQEAVASRKVYNSRARHLSTDTLMVVKHQDSIGRTEISLYSMRDKASFQLPPIPNVDLGIMAELSHFITREGQLYVLGDAKRGQCPVHGDMDKQDVYELDLAANAPQWKERSTIPGPVIADLIRRQLRTNLSFGCATIKGGHLYVRGGNAGCFDSAWHIHHGGGLYTTVCPSMSLILDSAILKFVWEPGKSYWLQYHSIEKWNNGTRSWQTHHSEISCAELGPFEDIAIRPLLALPIHGEIVAIVQWRYKAEGASAILHHCLLQSKGFGTASRDILWEKGPSFFHFDALRDLAMCPIQL